MVEGHNGSTAEQQNGRTAEPQNGRTAEPQNGMTAIWHKGLKVDRNDGTTTHLRRDLFYYKDSLFSFTANVILGGEAVYKFIRKGNLLQKRS